LTIAITNPITAATVAGRPTPRLILSLVERAFEFEFDDSGPEVVDVAVGDADDEEDAGFRKESVLEAVLVGAVPALTVTEDPRLLGLVIVKVVVTWPGLTVEVAVSPAARVWPAARHPTAVVESTTVL
jgi:hypothetical protein